MRASVPNDSLPRRTVWLAFACFSALLILLVSSHNAASRLHQGIAEAASLLIFGAVLVSLVRSAGPQSHLDEDAGYWIFLGLVAAALAYAPTLRIGFISDDFTHVVLARESISSTLHTQFTQGAFGTFFRPLGFLSFCLDYRLWHAWAPGWHFVNLVLHLACTLSVFYLCRELGCSRELSGTASLIFAVLPVNVEAVSWVAARFDLLATLLILWTLIFYLQARARNSAPRYILAMTCFAVALAAKESAYIIPLAMVALELFVVLPKRWAATIPFFAIAVLAVVLRLKILGSFGGYASAPGAPGSLSLSIRTVEGLLLRAPSELLFAINWLQPRVTFGYLLAAATGALLFPLALLPANAARRSLLAFALLWCFFGALPAQSMLMIPPSLVNTRVLYFSSAGAALLVALLLSRVQPPRSRRIWTLLLVVCFFATTEHDIRAWSHASTITRDFLAELRDISPNPPDRAEFVLYDMPRWTEGGVYLLLHRALGDAISLTYGRDDLAARRGDEASPPVENTVAIFWIADWQGKRRPLITFQK